MRVGWWAVFLVVLLAARLMGAFTVGLVTSGSMEPTLPTGSVFLGIHGTVEAGDLVVYRAPDGTPVVHRALAREGDGWITKGDANAETDQEQGLPPSRPYAVVPTVGEAPIAFRQAWLRPLGLVVAETALLSFGLKGFLDERRAAGRSAGLRPHHLVVAAAALTLVAAPFFHENVEARGSVTVGASLLPTLVRIEGPEGVQFHELAPFTTKTVEAQGEVDVVRSADLPGARALGAHGAVFAAIPLASALVGLAGALRWYGC